jgi:hypothetical protein
VEEKEGKWGRGEEGGGAEKERGMGVSKKKKRN